MENTKLSLDHFKKLVSSYTEQQFDKINEFAKDRFGLSEDIELKISYSNSRKRSRGGYSVAKKRMYISLVCAKYVRYAYNDYKGNGAFGGCHYNEYKGFEHSKTIGEFYGYWTLCLTSLICHEIAHAVQFNRTHGSGASIDEGYEGAVIEAKNGKVHAKHGLDFQYIYRVLREEFVNSFIGKQESFMPPTVSEISLETPVKREYKKSYLSSFDKKENIYNYFTPEKELIGRILKQDGYYIVKPAFGDKTPYICATEKLVPARTSLLDKFNKEK